ncbi:helix-turn-helix transcriptional regulator [Fusobacterium perfoetens]|uniref:helix-turn-helix domain-containing protein n=1 Tax=Fusobacterium perfoetens TaxID=852 RepID=UPI001F2531C1|nr:helix-turn-helix domain-containing protein [Fusobacterium perfoetens]MCF2624976.1 helix-turn-helix transcriptional regulator [Fusobacterium perfoetens]
MEFKDALKLIRKKRKLSQPELAKLIGKERQSILRYENGVTKPSVATVELLCKVLEVPIYTLMGEVDISEIKDIKKHSKELDDVFSKSKEILAIIKDYRIEEQEAILNITKESLKFYKEVK